MKNSCNPCATQYACLYSTAGRAQNPDCWLHRECYILVMPSNVLLLLSNRRGLQDLHLDHAKSSKSVQGMGSQRMGSRKISAGSSTSTADDSAWRLENAGYAPPSKSGEIMQLEATSCVNLIDDELLTALLIPTRDCTVRIATHPRVLWLCC